MHDNVLGITYQYAKSRCKWTGLFINASEIFHQIYIVPLDAGICIDIQILIDLWKSEFVRAHTHKKENVMHLINNFIFL